jgi:hypothetical protein
MVCRHFEVLDCLSFSSTGIWSDTLMPRGYGGVAILWKKELDSLITSLKIGNERIL